MIPTIAYSGEIDKQKQAADVMAAACEKEGITLTHLIGPQTGHKIHPDSKLEIERRLAEIAKQPKTSKRIIDLTTMTLRYNSCEWVSITSLKSHWEPARLIAKLSDDGARLVVWTNPNVNEFEIRFPSGSHPVPKTIDIVDVENPRRIGPRDPEPVSTAMRRLPNPTTDGSFLASFRRYGSEWQPAVTTRDGLHKRHGLQGPIDDAFMDSFLFVKPTGKPLNEAVGQWADAELTHAITHWRQQMRGDARVKADTEIADADIAAHNLVLWGDPQSNALLAKVLPKLPIQWTADGMTVNGVKYASASRVPVMIFPNPLNPQRYVVLNSSFTYREYDYLNNARQTPKLPDWAVIDIRTPVSSRSPAKSKPPGSLTRSGSSGSSELADPFAKGRRVSVIATQAAARRAARTVEGQPLRPGKIQGHPPENGSRSLIRTKWRRCCFRLEGRQLLPVHFSRNHGVTTIPPPDAWQ